MQDRCGTHIRSREPWKDFFSDASGQHNTPSVIFAGKLVARVVLATNKPAEVAVLQISQDNQPLESDLAVTSGQGGA